ncbi:HAD-IIIC family phosphatase [Candidatus Omnitrophota bacterium]
MDKYEVAILSNIIVSQLCGILEYYLRKESIDATARTGGYDNILQDSAKFKDSDLVIIFWELANVVNGFQYKVNSMDSGEIESLISRIKDEIDFVLINLKKAPLVLFNKFSSLIFTTQYVKKNNFDNICRTLNQYLQEKAPSNVILIDTDKVIAQTSIHGSVDFRFYYSSRVLYGIEFYKNYSEYVKPIILAAHGKSKKILVFDCDNTLWKGVLGEDGHDGIEMSGKTQNGSVFEDIQYMALELQKRGILLGLCSKNNPQDIDRLFAAHPDMKIKDEDITIKKVNWNDKVTNLKEIARELNIGLDSVVMLEDSDFEVNYIREFLPDVTVLQVPANLHEYPSMLSKYMGLFFNLSESEEDSKKTIMYRRQAKREGEKSTFKDITEYLKSLELELTVYCDNESIIPRMSQMTQKTNQFNLTTKRYTESDIEKFITSAQYKTFAFSIRDRFGDYGITGLCIAKLDPEAKNAHIDTFLMSCRVIGRNVEVVFLNFIIDYLRDLNIDFLCAEYIKTLKNMQVADFYDDYGLSRIENGDGRKVYKIHLSKLKPKKIDYIKVKYGR